MKYLVEFKTFTITEGGNAFPDAQSLTRAEVEPAFAKFQSAMTQLFGEAELELIGSWKQKDISGDLDALFYSEQVTILIFLNCTVFSKLQKILTN